ncbi:hypothetical protein MXB_2661 [Myxobolus squamalis]|nr:hypothetical protein MXB_2661 [Myxobolus squamalis]
MEDSMEKTARHSFDAKIAILWYLPLNSPYVLRWRKGKPSLMRGNGMLSMFSIELLFLRGCWIHLNCVFFNEIWNAAACMFRDWQSGDSHTCAGGLLHQ